MDPEATMRSMQTFLFFGPLSVGCAMAQADAALRERLQKLTEDLQPSAGHVDSKLDDDDLDLLERAQVDIDRFGPGDAAGIVKILRFGASLRDADWPAAVAYALGQEGRALAWPMMLLSVQRGRMDDAAQLTTSAVRDASAEQ